MLVGCGVDAAGKDEARSRRQERASTRREFKGVSFKQPSAEELDQTICGASPRTASGRGEIGIFTRLYTRGCSSSGPPEILDHQKLPREDKEEKRDVGSALGTARSTLGSATSGERLPHRQAVPKL